MLKSKIAGAVALGMLALPLTACGESEPEYVGVCVDPETEVRLDDDACEQGDDDFLTYAVLWYMLSSSSRSYPPVGGHVNRSYFKTSLPKSAKVSSKHLPASGGTSVKSYVKPKSSGGIFKKSTTGGTSSKPKTSFGSSRGRR